MSARIGKAASVSRIGAICDRIVYVLIFYATLTFALETLPEARQFAAFFLWSERVTVGIFAIEYVLRAVLVGRGYVLGAYGLIDLAAVLPSLVSMGVADLRVLRILRFMRLLRLAKLRKYGLAWEHFSAALASIKEELIVYLVLTTALLFLSSVGIYYCERDAQPEAFRSFFHAMWWSIATLTTVGYGDVYPVTGFGKVFTGLILVIGVSVLSVPSALIASALVRMPRSARKEVVSGCNDAPSDPDGFP